MDQADITESRTLTVFYNGSCPICYREIHFYKGRRGADRLSWVDVSRLAEDEVMPGLAKHRALAGFHLRYADGTLVSGGEAFAGLWAALPAFRPLGRLMQAAVAARQVPRADLLPDWPVRSLDTDVGGDLQTAGAEGEGARFAPQRRLLIRSIARLRSRAAR